MKLSGERKRGRPKRRYIDVVNEDMAGVEVTEEDTEEDNCQTEKADLQIKLFCCITGEGPI